MIYFDEEYFSSIKSIAIENNSEINLTSRFLNGKRLMFRKASIKSFTYDLIDVFMFTPLKIQEIYRKYLVDQCYVYQNLTDADSTSMFFVFLCNLDCCRGEDKARNTTYNVLIKSKIFGRFIYSIIL